MKNDLHIQSVMHPLPHSVGYDQTLHTAKVMLAEYGIRHLPVQKGGELIGVISERDIHFALSVEHAEPEELKVADCVTEELFVVGPGEPVAAVARQMAEQRIGCALIVENDKLVGIFTTVDACRTLHRVLEGDLSSK
ncbi:MAG: CBS domain-containing protein [Bdellovibrionales bacterium]|nr:CBS domain-containing protein [Bdellovibrionales bacterium]